MPHSHRYVFRRWEQFCLVVVYDFSITFQSWIVGKSATGISPVIGKLKEISVGTSALAGMSVNCAIFNVIAAISSPLCTGTLTLVAKARGLSEMNERCMIAY